MSCSRGLVRGTVQYEWQSQPGVSQAATRYRNRAEQPITIKSGPQLRHQGVIGQHRCNRLALRKSKQLAIINSLRNLF